MANKPAQRARHAKAGECMCDLKSALQWGLTTDLCATNYQMVLRSEKQKKDTAPTPRLLRRNVAVNDAMFMKGLVFAKMMNMPATGRPFLYTNVVMDQIRVGLSFVFGNKTSYCCAFPSEFNGHIAKSLKPKQHLKKSNPL